MKSVLLILLSISFTAQAEIKFKPTEVLTKIIQDRDVIKLLDDNGKILQIQSIVIGGWEGYQIISEKCKLSATFEFTVGSDRNPWPWAEHVRIIENICK